MAVTEGVTLDGMIRSQVVLDKLIGRTSDLSPLMERIGAYGEESTVHRFESQTGPDGQRWEPSHRAQRTGGQTLVDSGRLRSSITWRADADSAEWGTNVLYAGTHQLGATIRAKSGGRLTFHIPGIGFRSPEEVVIPARPFMGISNDDQDEIDAQVQDFIAEGLQ